MDSSDSLHVVHVCTNLLGFVAAEVQSSVSVKVRICQKEWGQLQVLLSVCLYLETCCPQTSITRRLQFRHEEMG